MAYKIDVLISFATEDNEPLGSNDKGWVSDFKYFLELMLEQVNGEKPNILLRPEGDTITGADLDEVASFITILSPYLIASPQSLDLLEDFGAIAEKRKAGGVFKVIKAPVPAERQPARIRQMIGFEMYKLDTDTGVYSDIKDYFEDTDSNSYWMNIVDIAYDIYETISKLSGKSNKTLSINDRKVIYLAETSHELSVQRNIIKRELQRHGFKIYPDKTLSTFEEQLEKEVTDYIQAANYSIHMIGTSYGDIPEGSEKSIVDIQNKIAADKGRVEGHLNFPRLIWITPSLKYAAEKQLTFIENIKRDSDISEGAEILQTPLEDFKNIIREEIIEGKLELKKKFVRESSSSGKESIYLIHDKVDAESARKIQKNLEGEGYEVLLPKFEGNLLEVRENHIHHLREFDAAIVLQNKVNRQWVRMKILDMLKAPGFGRAKAMKGRAVITTDVSPFEQFEKQGITVIDNDNSMSDNLNVFLRDLK